MSSNTTVGPAGDNKSFDGVLRPDNFTPTRDGGSESEQGGNGESLAGPDQGDQDTFSNAGGGAAGDMSFDPDHDSADPSHKEVSVDGTVGDHNRDNQNTNDGGDFDPREDTAK